MRFSAFLRMAKKDTPHMRLSYQLMVGSWDFPESSTKFSIEVFCKKHQLSDEATSSLIQSWCDFEVLPYATIHRKRGTKRVG